MQALGDLIGGNFVAPKGAALESTNPAKSGETVFETACSVDRVAEAAEAAFDASKDWCALDREQRFEALISLREAIAGRSKELVDAIVLETGKLRSEATGEVGALIGRFNMVKATVDADLAEGQVAGFPGEQMRYHPLGVVGVIGPFNYPLHLCHAHTIPALLMGNAVVVKGSEITPLCAQVYAQAVADSNIPPGVFNMVQGGGDSGAALAKNSHIRGLCFTGSYRVGREISEAAIERPELLVALEMGGKNTVVVAEDADLRQAAHEIVVGGYLTTGQRCTCTDRVLVHKSRRAELLEALVPMVESLRFGDPESPDSFAGPLATAGGVESLERATQAARDAGARSLATGSCNEGGNFAQASVHLLPDGLHHVGGYTDVELFGPDVGVESFATDDEAIAVLRDSEFGLANSVFTFSNERFERFYRETNSGILNRNRSTNQASPRLPFGGLGKSGNYRPAGAHAARNVVASVAVQENVIGRIVVHDKLLDYMPPPELDRLASQHDEEEAREASRTLLKEPRPMSMNLPRGGKLPRSEELLSRLYAAERVVREKKPPVFDHLRSAGPWMVSVDDEPLSVLDGMSQTATLCGGFAEDRVVCGYTEGEFGDTLVRSQDPAVRSHDAAVEFATVLRQMVPGLSHVTYANSGAEANDKALALARLHSQDDAANKVLAFEGSFHGRTLLPLSLTYNPAKRGPYEIAGYEGSFAPFPVWATPDAGEPDAPSGFYAYVGMGDLEELSKRFGDAEEDELLAREVASLSAVNERLRSSEFFACIVEPMQSEGGDRYATQRFYRALRLLTRHHSVPLILDEVQTGFGLGGEFAWHSKFQFVNFRGKPDFPDAVVFAKRAQLGVCMSVWDDPEVTSVQPASLIRGRMHAEMVATQHAAERVEKRVRKHLDTIAQGFPHLVGAPRAQGFAFAFDLPSTAHLMAYLGQRFWRGAIVFGAGAKTVRYRLSDSYLARDIELLFDTVRRSLAWLDAHPGAKPPTWEDLPALQRKRRVPPELRIRNVLATEALDHLAAILDIELRVYEPARRTAAEHIRAALENSEGVVMLAEAREGEEWSFVGFAIGQPLEAVHASEEGPDRDPMLGQENSLYSVSVTVCEEFQGFGIGRSLKEAQLREAALRRRADGSPRYRFVTGRNRVGHTAAMAHLNRAFGAHLVCVLTGQYEDPEGQAIYYRMPLGPMSPVRKVQDGAIESMAMGISTPFSEVPASLVAAEKTGLLYGPAVNKLTVMNYATPAIVRALEWVSALAPKLPHMYLTSCRDELVDKCLRLVRTHRTEAQVAIGMVGGYVGHTTAAARSISDAGVHRQGPKHFDWPLLPHPCDVGTAAMVGLLREIVADAGGAKNILGLFVEPVQERTGRSFDAEGWSALHTACRELDIPLLAFETASGCYRSCSGSFASSAWADVPDVLAWWGGAHTGYIHTCARYRVAKPLAMVSTWDGDELSLVREHHQLRAARTRDLTTAAAAWDGALELAERAGMTVRGRGLYRVIAAGARAEELHQALLGEGVDLRQFPGGYLAAIPSLDTALQDAARLQAALERVL
ncbi:MAG: aldehyde dehydrogenase family protein [Myxococcales bacterium]|nr:aldehyde dehydrogenase family protein [Myxococcales bacterium]